MRGQLVRTLVNGVRPAGSNQVIWDGKDQSGAEVASGTDQYRLQSGEQIEQRKMLLLK